MLQYNFKIDETLKLELEKALLESNSSNKSDFLANMLTAYQVQRVSNTQTDLDLSKYDSVNQEAKESIGNAFKHILTLLDSNSSTVKQEKIAVDDAYKSLEAKELAYQSELEQLQADSTAQLDTLKRDAEERITNGENQAKELATMNQGLQGTITELNQKLEITSQIATQVKFITEENQELRTTAKLYEDNSKRKELEASTEIKELQESNFKQDFALTQHQKDYHTLEERLAETQRNFEIASKSQKEEIKELNQVISVSQANLNQALGKLEILSPQKPI